MPSFDALRQPWIPAENMDGVIQEYGIRGVIERAHALRCLNDSSPVFLYGMYRLLIAFLTDALRPESIDDLLGIYEEGVFPQERIEAYIEDCEKDGPCFDLFDKHRPFLQSAYNDKLDKQEKTVAMLVLDVPTGNNLLHFDHRDEKMQAFSPATCARGLSSINVFCTADAQNPSGINGAPPWYVLVRGENLFETLLFNIWLPHGELPFDDPPIAWRNSAAIVPGREVSRTSYLYGLTWQARRIKLIPSEPGQCTYSGGHSELLVQRVYYQRGWKFAGHALWTDPHTPRVLTEKGTSSMKPRDGRSAWRDLAPLTLCRHTMPTGSSSKVKALYRSPEVVNQYVTQWANELVQTNPSASSLRVEVFGLATNQAKLLSWVHDQLVIPVAIALSPPKSDLLQAEIEIVETIAREIKRHISKSTAAGNGTRDKKKKKSAVSESIGLSVEQRFFNEARKLLYGILVEDLQKVKEDEEGWRNDAIREWRQHMRDMSRSVFDDALEKSGTKATDMKTSVSVRREFIRKLSKILAVEEVKPNG